MSPAVSLRGKFITFEGGEGCGKSTHAHMLTDALQSERRKVVLTREPGGSPGAESIRTLLVEGEPGRWDSLSEALLMIAARHDHVEKAIRPALESSAWVICDRFVDSTVAYQGYGGGVALDLIERLNAAAVGDIWPDLTLIFDVPVEVGLARAAKRAGHEDRFERKDVAFHRRLRDGFLTIARAEPERCAIVSTEAEVADVARRVMEIVEQRLGVTAR